MQIFFNADFLCNIDQEKHQKKHLAEKRLMQYSSIRQLHYKASQKSGTSDFNPTQNRSQTRGFID